MTQLISIIAGLFNLVAGASYLKQIIKDESTPNPSTWVVVMVVSIINAATYLNVVAETPWIALSSWVTALMVSLIFVASLFKGKFTKLNQVDIICLVLAVIIGTFWQLSDNALVSNISLQAIFVIAFCPTINGLLKGSGKERSFSWALGSCSYILQILNILLNPVILWALAFPVIQLLGQGTIALLAYYQTQGKRL